MKYSTALYFCKAVPHAVVFVVVFQVYAHYLMLKFDCNESDEKPIFEVIRSWFNFRLRSFLCQGTLMTKNSGCSLFLQVNFLYAGSYCKLLILTSYTKFELNSLKNNEITNYRHFWLSRHCESQKGRHI